MRDILSKSGSLIQQLHYNKFGAKGIAYSFTAIPPNMTIQRGLEFQFKFRTMIKMQKLNDYLLQNKQDIKKYGKTILLQFLNEYPMQSFKSQQDETDSVKKQEKYKMKLKVCMFLIELEDLNFYQLNMKYAILKKMLNYIGQNSIIIEEANKTEKVLIKLIKTGNLHVTDVLNWLYMLPLNYKQQHSCLAFDVLDAKFEHPEIREYLRSQRSLTILIKRMSELDWSNLRKYKNIIKFFCQEASTREVDSLQEVLNQFERLALLKLHQVDEKVIPKMMDQIILRFNFEFSKLKKSKHMLMRIFSIFKYLPLNYNIQFFNKVHNFLKTKKQLPAHLLMYLPYNKLTPSETVFLQSKIFTTGRDDIARKLIYTIYEPEYNDSLTSFIIEKAYYSMLQMWKKNGLKFFNDYQIYLSLIFRFIKMNNPIIDQSKLKHIFIEIAQKIQKHNFDVFNTFSVPALIDFLELCGHYDVHLNQKNLTLKMKSVLSFKRKKNPLSYCTKFLMPALKLHYNALHKKSKYFLTQFINQIADNPQVDLSKRIQLIFLIEKAINPEEKWLQVSKRLCKQLTQDADFFAEIYIRYDRKTLQLTNFVFNVLYQRKVHFSTVFELLSNFRLQLIISPKGKLISPLKRYINDMDLAEFDISQLSMETLAHSFRLLFYFKNEISDFMKYFSIKIIKKIQEKLKAGQCLNGKQFASLSNYVMEVVKDIEIKKKASIIQQILSIIKTLYEKQGICLRVYELNFLCSNQKYIKINKDELERCWSDIIGTLKNTDRAEHHKELMFIVIKLYCYEFIKLNSFDLQYFKQNCTQMIEHSALNLSEIKQCLGYEILECENKSVLQKMKIYLGSLVELAFRKDKRMKSYFMCEYYLKFFSKLQMKEMIIEICEKLFREKFYPFELCNIVLILNKNQIKNKKLIKRILQIMPLSESFVLFEKIQVAFWLEKTVYDFFETDLNFNQLKHQVHEEILQKISSLQLHLKNQLNQQDRSIETEFEVQDPNFDKNYKLFIQYAWTSLKYKNTKTPEIKFICRYLFFGLQKIKERIENLEERKQIQKIKLYHVLKYIKEMGIFDIDEEKVDNTFRKKNLLEYKVRKNKILNQMEEDLNVMKIQPCEKLQKRLAEFGDLIRFKTRYRFQVSKKEKPIVEFYVQQKFEKNKNIVKNKFVIHTVKKYHMTIQSDSLPQVQQQTGKQSSPLIKKHEIDEISFFKAEEIDIIVIGLNDNSQDTDLDKKLMKKIQDELKDSYIEKSYLSLELKLEKDRFAQKAPKQEKVPQKPLFSKPLFSKKATQVKIIKAKSKQQLKHKFETVFKVQKAAQELCRDYNGYLKIQKSLIELSTGLKCIIYDPQRDIFFD